MNLQNIRLKGEEFVIDGVNTLNTIGKNTVLEDCTLRLRVPSDCLSIQGELIDTTVIVEKGMAGYSWLDAKLIRCTFQGTFRENEFGAVSNEDGCCDAGVFTNANLDDCTFYGDSSDLHIFPTWPNFVIRDPLRHLPEMQNRPKCEELEIFVDSHEYLDEEAAASAYNVNTIAKRHDVDHAAVKKFFSQFPFVRM